MEDILKEVKIKAALIADCDKIRDLIEGDEIKSALSKLNLINIHDLESYKSENYSAPPKCLKELIALKIVDTWEFKNIKKKLSYEEVMKHLKFKSSSE